jgi:GT2 family glycosyltransferase
MTSDVLISDLVSTIIPVYNRPEMLRQAVGSVLAQTYRPIEIIVVDDGSTDETPRVAEVLAAEHPEEIRFLRKENSGPGPTREAGRLLARGEFIQYLDSDDLLRPRKFEIMVQALRERPECGAAYGYICLHPENGPPLATPYKESGIARETLFPRILADRWWNTDAPLFRRSICDAVGPWSDLRWSQDWEYDGRVGALGTRLVHCPEFVCDQRQHSEQRQTTPANWMQPLRLRERRRFLEMMFGHAEQAGVAPETPERKHFARWCFAVARQCAAMGVVDEARRCLDLADRAAGSERDVRKGFRGFWWATRILGWQITGRCTLAAEALWPQPSNLTLMQSFAQHEAHTPRAEEDSKSP